MEFVFVALTILLTVYGQLVVKWQVVQAGPFPDGAMERILFLIRLVFNPWIFSTLVAAFFAALSWMAALTKLPLSTAYPFNVLSLVTVIYLSHYFFHEPLTWGKIAGAIFISAGIILCSRA